TTVFNMYAQTELGLNAFQAGLVTVPYVIMAVVMIRLGEKLSLRFGGKPLLLVGPLFPAIGIMFISLTVLPTDWYVGIVVFGFVICAIGNGLCATLGGALGIALNTTIFAAVQVNHSASVAATTSFLTGLLIMIIGVILTQIIIPKNIKA